MSFAKLRFQLDRQVFQVLSDGLATIDGIEIEVMYDKSSFQFEDSRGTEQLITLSESLADDLGLKPKKTSRVIWQGVVYDVAHPPIYEEGLIKLVLM